MAYNEYYVTMYGDRKLYLSEIVASIYTVTNDTN